MGIRYYAYAVDAQDADRAQVDPRAFIASDPLADAWGMEPHTMLSVATFEQRSPGQQLLYLDKAWPYFQVLTAPVGRRKRRRPASRMFEGHVTFRPDGGWDPWVRALAPDDMPAIGDDLAELAAELGGDPFDEGEPGETAEYVLHFLHRARDFVDGLVRDSRGMAYLIG